MGTNEFISIGNSDDRLSQREWADFIAEMAHLIGTWSDASRLQVHGTWYSGPDQPWQNANWCVEIQPPRWYTNSSPSAEQSVYPTEHMRRERQCREDIAEFRRHLQDQVRDICRRFRQDTFAWTTGEVKLIPTGWIVADQPLMVGGPAPLSLVDLGVPQATVDGITRWFGPGESIPLADIGQYVRLQARHEENLGGGHHGEMADDCTNGDCIAVRVRQRVKAARREHEANHLGHFDHCGLQPCDGAHQLLSEVTP